MAFFKRRSATGFLARLARDKGGNVLAITAAAVIPMIGVVGGAIDASRLYMVRSRLQAACDSAVLAGRKAMTTTVYDTVAQTRAAAMFNSNYKDTDFQTSGAGFSAAADASGRLNGTATKTIPMTLMKMFGFGSTTATVQCSADIQIPNIDVVFVLDVTGSMASSLGSTTRIQALKDAAKSFYQTLATQMAANGTNAGQVRYGFVPYDQTVRVTDLFKSSPNTGLGQASLSNIADTMTVQSRVANMTTGSGGGSSGDWVVDTSVTPTVYVQQYRGNDSDSLRPYTSVNGGNYKMSNNDCDWYSANQSFNISSSGGGSTDVTLYPYNSYPGNGVGYSVLYIPQGSTVAQTSEPTSGSSYVKITFSRDSGTWEDNNGGQINHYQKCKRNVTHTTYKRSTNGFRFTNWTYKPITVDVSSYKTGAPLRYIGSLNSHYEVDTAGSYDPIQLAALTDQSGLYASNAYWNGCVEERDTVAASSFSPIPANAFDLNWLLAGTSDQTKWRPVMQPLTYDRSQIANRTTTSNYSKATTSCPDASVRNLNPMTQTEFNTYIDTLEPGGNTYLDVGMIWGLRLIAPQGMFGYRNLTGPNGGQISRHIIFLTDGEPVSRGDTYSAYGVEDMAGRITGSTGLPAASLHAARFQALCDGMRGTVSIWAIALSTSVGGNLQSCADPGRAYQADDATQLNAAFQNIARDIADLRLVQ
jgi:Flp pilus assembly protein TadG